MNKIKRITHLFRSSTDRGFSLLELILVLAILGIAGMVGIMGFVHFSRGFVFARQATAVTAKGQLALMRLAKEFQSLSDTSTATPTRVAYTAIRNGTDETHETRMVGSTLLLDNQVLVDQVTGLSFTYHNTYDSGASGWSTATRMIGINLILGGPDNTDITLQTRVALRNM
jgi:prepilin-type N-terminal cleavage/methylation domain-containing protein